MQILARKTGTIAIFDVSGEIDFANSPQVRQSLLREIQESRTPCVMVNLNHVRYLYSSGIASLVEALWQISLI